VTDGGVENVNAEVGALTAFGLLNRVVALVEIDFSNSLMEAFWRRMKHAWLYSHELSDLATVSRLVTDYVRDHNELITHAAFAGQTPDEVYFGRAAELPADLGAARASARAERMKTNRTVRCSACAPGVEPSASPAAQRDPPAP
jgi:hypothetical protein